MCIRINKIAQMQTDRVKRSFTQAFSIRQLFLVLIRCLKKILNLVEYLWSYL
jgi:hypothetical protein